MAVRVIQYTVKVDIHEVKDLIFNDGAQDFIPNPYVEVNVNDVSQSTINKNQVSSTTFNTSFNFTAALTKEEFLRKAVEINVMHKYYIQSVLIGKYVLSLSYVHSKSQHWIYRQWVKLRNYDRPAEDVGIILLTVGVFGPSDPLPIIDDAMCVVNEEEGGRSAKVLEVKITHYNLCVNIYKGQDIAPVPGINMILEPFVKVRHAGAEEQSKVIKNDSNPEFNVAICLPACIPCHDNNVLIELWNGEPNLMRGSHLMNSVCLNFFELIKTEITPVWKNVYWRPPANDVVGMISDLTNDATQREPNHYAGRLLISASAIKVQSPLPKGIRMVHSSSEPQATEHVLWIDIYEVACNSTTQTSSDVAVEVQFGPHILKTPLLRHNELKSYIVDEIDGRLEELRLYLPDESMCWDFFLYMVVDSTSAAGWFKGENNISERIAWCSIPFSGIHTTLNNIKPIWYTLKNMNGSGDAFRVLLSICCTPYKHKMKREPRLEYNLTKYYFRTLIYEGLHIPAIGTNEFPNPYVKVELAGEIVQTSTIMQTLNPTWYEAYEIPIMLPENLNLAPDISVEVCSVSNSFMSSDITLGSMQYNITKVPKEWKKAPQWFDLRSNHFKRCKARILMSFELVTFAESARYTFYDDIRPSTKEASVALFIVGIRMFNLINKPVVTVSFGRDVDDTNVPLWSESCGTATGKGGNWNFLKEFFVNVSLPKRQQHHAFLEVKVENKENSNALTGVNITPVGMAYISLNPLLPWLDDYERKECLENFKLQMLEDVIIEEAEEALKDKVVQDVHEDFNVAEAEEEAKLKRKKVDIDPKVKIPHNDPDSANTRVTDTIDFIAYKETENEKHYTKASENKNDQHDIECFDIKRLNSEKIERLDMEHNNIIIVNDNEELPDTKMKNDIEKEGKTKQDKKKETNKMRHKYNILTNKHGKRKNAICSNDKLDIFGFHQDLLNFELKLFDENEPEEELRDEISYEMEVDFTPNDLPYLRTPIFKCTSAGIPETVGYLKYICNVFNENNEKEQANMKEKCKMLVQQYANTPELVVRAYILQAKGLVPPSSSSDICTYVWIKNSEDSVTMPGGLSCNIRDTGNIKRQGFRPEFNKCYQLFCILPDHSIVQVAIMLQGTIMDECIGRTFIDVEDRYFNKKIQAMILDDTTPIELRRLKNEGSTVSHGTLRGWFELMTFSHAQTHLQHQLACSEPDDYQLRVVIWRLKGVPFEEEQSISIFVRGTYQVDERQEINLETDTHFNSRDGTALYNWRFVYNIKIPAQIPILKLQIWEYSIITSTDPIGECNFDFSLDFYHARRKKKTVRLPKMWVTCYHPVNKKKPRGYIEIEAIILTAQEAEMSPVGQGREEPNKDPFLPPVLANRTYVDWNNISKAIGEASSAIMSRLKWSGIWLAVAAIVALTIFILFLLKR